VSITLFLLLPLAALLLLAPLVLVVLAVTARPDAQLGPATAAARTHAVTGSAVALVCGACAGVALAWDLLSNELGFLPRAAHVWVAAVPAAAALAHTGVLALTEVTWPRPRGSVRRASLAARTVPAVAPALLRRCWLVATLSLLVVLAVAAVLAAPDGASIEAALVQDGAVVGTRGYGPFPGARYGVPAALGALLLAAAVQGTLRLVVDRPAVAGADAATDTALRRASAHRVVRGAAVGTLLTLAPVLLSLGSGIHRVWPSTGLQVLSGVLVVAGVLAGLAGVLLLFWVAPRVPSPAIPAATQSAVAAQPQR